MKSHNPKFSETVKKERKIRETAAFTNMELGDLCNQSHLVYFHIA